MLEIRRILGLEHRCRGQRLQFDRVSSSEFSSSQFDLNKLKKHVRMSREQLQGDSKPNSLSLPRWYRIPNNSKFPVFLTQSTKAQERRCWRRQWLAKRASLSSVARHLKSDFPGSPAKNLDYLLGISDPSKPLPIPTYKAPYEILSLKSW